MRNRKARVAVLVFVLAFPFLMVAASPKGFSESRAILPLFGVEAILLGGIAFAASERKRHESALSEEPTFKLGKVTSRPLAKPSRSAGVSVR